MNRASVFVLLACAAATAGCASQARVVKLNKEEGSGTVAIPNNTDSWPFYNRTAAEDLIAKQVGPSYRIVSEGEFVKGKSKQITLDADSATYAQQQMTEYRISFVRVVNPPVPPVTPEGPARTQTGEKGPAPGQGPPPGTIPSVLPTGAQPPATPGAK
jgi:hypothetical protein